MKVQTVILAVLLALISLLTSDRVSLSAETSPRAPLYPERMRFQITTVEERAGERNIISEASVEGPPGTDFNINLEGGRFRMRARFLTDPIRRDALKVRAKLDTRRFYGYSERELPLYEEDTQSQTLEVGFDEAVILLPFGSGGGDHRLKIEITPAMSEQTARLPSGKARPLEIKILKPSPGGAIGIEATKIPHNFTVEAVLLENGREVARGLADYPIEEAREITLQPNEGAGPELTRHPLAVNLVIDRYARSRPTDQVTVGFDVYRGDRRRQGGGREAVALKWAGVADLGSPLTYDLSDHFLNSTGKKYELRFKINLARGEPID